tara:strand:- start:1195 stop:1758 length:564 start_codon:yes stop_codon:yes gene_type:complete
MENALQLIADFGFFNIVLPFIFVYALVYGVLIKVDIFDFSSDQGKNVTAIVSLASAFFVIAATDVVDLMLGVIPQATFMLVVILFGLMIFGMLGIGEGQLLGSDSMFGRFKWLAGLVLITVFMLMVDAGTPNGIPLLRDLNQILLGQGAFGLAQSQAVETLIGLSFAVGLPIAIVLFLTLSRGSSKG